MGSLEQFTRGVIKRIFAEDYPHLQLPAVLYASITGRRELADTYEITGLTITNETGGQAFEARCTAHWQEYTLTVVDRFGNANARYPRLPGVRSRLQLPLGAVVAVALAEGELNPVIIGEVGL